MAREIFAYMPSGQTLTVDLVNRATGAVAQAGITLTETPASSGVYKGSGVTVAAGIYQATVKAGATVVGSFGYVRSIGSDPEVVEVSDGAGAHDGIKLGTGVLETNQAGDFHTVTRTES